MSCSDGLDELGWQPDVQGLELLIAAALGLFVVGAEPVVCDQENYGDTRVSLFDCKVEYTIMRLRELAGYPPHFFSFLVPSIYNNPSSLIKMNWVLQYDIVISKHS